MNNNDRKFVLLSNDNVVGQFLRSVITGGAASLADIGIFSFGISVLGINYLVSNTLSFTVGLTVNYLLSREWVFKSKVHNVKRDFLLFAAVGLVGLMLSNVLLYIFIDLGVVYYFIPLTSGRLAKSTAKAVVIFLVFLWNFFARREFVFST